MSIFIFHVLRSRIVLSIVGSSLFGSTQFDQDIRHWMDDAADSGVSRGRGCRVQVLDLEGQLPDIRERLIDSDDDGHDDDDKDKSEEEEEGTGATGDHCDLTTLAGWGTQTLPNTVWLANCALA